MRRKLIFLLYRAVLAAAFPFVLLYLLWRGARQPSYFQEIHERFGWLAHPFQRTAAGAVWLHAVSVGEILSAPPLIHAIRRRLPWAPIFVSTTTLAGRRAAVERLKGQVDGVFYAPLDYVFAVRRILRTIRPLAVVVLETEIWPNLYREARRAGAALVVVNGRISDKAFPSYRRLRIFFGQVLRLPHAILVQGEQDRNRYRAAGAPEELLQVSGNLKYDFEPRTGAPPEELHRFLQEGAGSPLWIAASTVAPEIEGDVDEDDVVIETYLHLRERHPGLRLILAPRKPERFLPAADKLFQHSVAFQKRSELGSDLPGANVLLLDSIGELSGIFGYADVVFVGGTLAHRGGHNIIEPAACGRAVIIGPHMENFPDVAARFVHQQGCLQIRDATELTAALDLLLHDASRRAELGNQALRLADAERGATARAVETIARHYAQALPFALPNGLLYPLLRGLSWIWKNGGERKRRRLLARQVRLQSPVISVGGITAGGAGKTPFVAFLAAELRAAGYQPAILSRGYQRSTPEKLTLLARGSTAPVALTGDEGQILLRRGDAHLAIGKDRGDAGLAMERSLPADIFLLDDGFQHARVVRDLDIVLIDALDPFGGCALIPVGRLREPLESLSRAHLFVVTRIDEGRKYPAIEEVLRRHNPGAPIFHSRVVPRGWRRVDDNQTIQRLPDGPVAGFCGLGNPASFWRTLENLGIPPVFRWNFPDHHAYKPAEVRQIVARARRCGARALVTTEKDAVNLALPLRALLGDLPLFYLSIEMELEHRQAFLERIAGNVKSDRKGLL